MKFLPGEQGETFKINLYDHGCGVAVGDYNGDGHDDIYLLNQLGPNAFYRNRGDGTFEDVTDELDLALDDRICVGGTFADYDNDGDQDLYVTSTRGGNLLFRNEENCQFIDVTAYAGLENVGHSQSSVFFDFDRDGLLDLYVAQTAAWTTDAFDDKSGYFPGKSGILFSAKEYNLLYHNEGNGTFADVTESAGLGGRGWSGYMAIFDFDEDGWLDVLVACMFGRAQLYRNQQDGTFRDVTWDVLGKTPWGGTGVKVFDFDNDGLVDAFVTSGMGYPFYYWHNYLMIQEGGHFVAFRLRGTRSNRDAIGALVRLRVGDQTLTRQIHSTGGYLSCSSKTLQFGLGDAEQVDEMEILWPSGFRQAVDPPPVDALHEIIEPQLGGQETAT